MPELKKAGCRRIYEATVGGDSIDRPELAKCLDRLDKGDTLVAWRLDRLGRSIRDLLQSLLVSSTLITFRDYLR